MESSWKSDQGKEKGRLEILFARLVSTDAKLTQIEQMVQAYESREYKRFFTEAKGSLAEAEAHDLRSLLG
jgi:hypothetical protein